MPAPDDPEPVSTRLDRPPTSAGRSNADSTEVERLLECLREGEDGAGAALYERTYDTLYSLARAIAPGRTMGATALVNEAFVRLSARRLVPSDPRHFYRLVAQAMRHTVIDYHRRADHRPQTLESSEVLEPAVDLDSVGPRDLGRRLDVLAIEEALERLGRLAPDQAEIAELRLFGGYTLKEVASIVDRTECAVARRWRTARAFLTAKLA